MTSSRWLIKRLIDLLQVWVILVEMFMKFLQYWLIMKRNKLFTTNLSKEDKNQRIVYYTTQDAKNYKTYQIGEQR